MSPKKVLVTGVYGLIAGAVYRHLSSRPDQYEVYGLARRRAPSVRTSAEAIPTVPEDRFFLADLADLRAVEEAVQGMDAIVQMAADPRAEADWQSLLDSNIIGTRNVFEAASCAQVARVVYASSIMVSWGYQRDEPYRSVAEGRFDVVTPIHLHAVGLEHPPRPTCMYAATKVWGEALARYYADIHDMSVLCLRIGDVNAQDNPQQLESGPFWCSQRDIVQLVEKSLCAPEELKFGIFYGVSDNRWRWVDIEHARDVLGYAPRDSAERALSPS